MADDRVSGTRVISASAEAIFGVLADPTSHAAIDGTGWVCNALDSEPLTAAGQIFRMSMYNPNHPDGNYQMANQVEVFEPPNAISWEPGNRPATVPLASQAGSGATTSSPLVPRTPQLHQPVEQVGLVGHVAVEGHGSDPQALGDRGHRERLDALFVGHGKHLHQYLAPVDTRWPGHPS